MVSSLAVVFAAGASAQVPAGSWVLDKSVNFSGRASAAPKYMKFTTSSNLLRFSDDCSAHFANAPYRYDLPFQSFLKRNVSEQGMSTFLQRSFGLDLKVTKTYLHSDEQAFCTMFADDIFVNGDALILSDGESNFYQFRRQTSAVAPGDNATASVLADVKLSQLPMDLDRVERECLPSTRVRERGWDTKCSPFAYLNEANSRSKSKLARIVGSYDYLRQYDEAGKMNNPVSHGLHPIFIAFPPKGDVILVRVFNMEQTPDDVGYLPATYISIKEGKVVDQLDDHCNFDEKYVCELPGAASKIQLGADGRFARK